MNETCPFCTTAKQEGRILKDGQYAYVILSNPRLVAGHLLVIPKRHIEGKLQDLSKEEQDEILGFLVEFQAKILEKLASGCEIRQNYKPFIESSRTHVNHLHFHLYPREDKDEIYEKIDSNRDLIFKEISEEEKKRILHLLAD